MREMNEQIEFDVLLDDVLREVANREPNEGFKPRIMRRIETGFQRSVVSSQLVEAHSLLESEEGEGPVPFTSTAHDNVAALVEPPATPPLSAMTGRSGGGGGQPGPAPVSKGALPKFAEQQIVPPKAPPLEEPKIRIEPTIEVQKDMKMASNLPQSGMPDSPVVSTSMGNGLGTGVGSGNGPGLGSGSGGNAGGGPKRVGGRVSEPEVIYAVEPEFSEQARRAKVSGNVLVYLWVDEHGNPTHVRVARGIGLGLDEKAVGAVEQYRFKPAMENGRPVTVEMYVEVVFHIF